MKTFDETAFFFHYDSPVGRISIFYQENPCMLARIWLPSRPMRRDGPDASKKKRPPERAFAESIEGFFDEYFAGRPASVPWAFLRFEGFSLLERRVWEKTAGIPFGATASYGCIAKSIGRPHAARFVGNTLGKNPFPVMIPCHRVIRKNGAVGGFGSGIGMKRRLLAFESARSSPIPPDSPANASLA